MSSPSNPSKTHPRCNGLLKVVGGGLLIPLAAVTLFLAIGHLNLGENSPVSTVLVLPLFLGFYLVPVGLAELIAGKPWREIPSGIRILCLPLGIFGYLGVVWLGIAAAYAATH